MTHRSAGGDGSSGAIMVEPLAHRHVIVTGGTGALGEVVLSRLLQEPERSAMYPFTGPRCAIGGRR